MAAGDRPDFTWNLSSSTTFNSSSAYETNGDSFNLSNSNSSFKESLSGEGGFVESFGQAVKWMDYFFVPIVFSVGTVGNTLSFLVLMFSHIRRLSSSVYLAALAVSDTGFLFGVFVSWANNIGIHWYHQPGWCQTFVYMGYIFSFLSVWYVVAFTVERYIAVCLPFRRHTMCTARRAKIVVLSLTLFSLVGYNFAIWTTVVNGTGENKRCSLVKDYFYLISLISSVDTVITLLVPCAIILVLNVRITYAVVYITKQLKGETYSTCPIDRGDKRAGDSMMGRTRSNVKRMSTSSVHGKTTVTAIRHNSAISNSVSMNESRHSMSQVKVTNMLVIVSSAFLVLNLPSHLLRVYSILMSHLVANYAPSHLFSILQKFFMYVYYINFSINFFLYAACGKNFRHALFHSVTRLCYFLRKCAFCKPFAHQVTLQLNTGDEDRGGNGAQRQGTGACDGGGINRMTSGRRNTKETTFMNLTKNVTLTKGVTK